MIVMVLSENTSRSDQLGSEHGLSLYIETKKHKILFDTGASGLFAKNADKLGVDLSEVDLAVISHGHYDHGGGIKTFLSINSQAKIYLHQKAFEKHYSNRPGNARTEIGLDEALLPNKRFVFCGERCGIDDELELFSGVKAIRLVPSGNTDLFAKEGSAFIQDDFAHEQNLIINNGNQTLLAAGCAHNGIINIIHRFKEIKGYYPDHVIGGFHLYNRGSKQDEKTEITDEIGKSLLKIPARYYTCHCTGIGPYQRLKAVLGEQIDSLSTGDQLTF
ncbi:MAG TPA: MBL fold hydrolase [Clostridiales bacterium]|nr:MBL fold hydrolase [Clostridiales bacterium]